MREANAQAVFDDVCSGLRNSIDTTPELAIAIRDGRVGLWLTAPADSPVETRRRLLGLASIVADATLMLYIAEANVQLDDGPASDAIVCVSITPGQPDATEVRIRPFSIGRRGLRTGRRFESEVLLGSESALFGELIADLRAAEGAGGDTQARIAATQSLIGNGFDLQFDHWLDEELSEIIG